MRSSSGDSAEAPNEQGPPKCLHRNGSQRNRFIEKMATSRQQPTFCHGIDVRTDHVARRIDQMHLVEQRTPNLEGHH